MLRSINRLCKSGKPTIISVIEPWGELFVNPLKYVTLNCLDWFMVFNATFNNLSVISWRSTIVPILYTE